MTGGEVQQFLKRDAGLEKHETGPSHPEIYFDEARLLNMAHYYQRVTDWHKHTPAGFA